MTNTYQPAQPVKKTGLSSLFDKAKGFLQEAVQQQRTQNLAKRSSYQDAPFTNPDIKVTPSQLLAERFPKAKNFIIKYESIRKSGKPHLEPYYDEIGDEWTVGYGRTIGINKAEQKKQGLSNKQIKDKYRMSNKAVAENDIDKQVEQAYNAVKKYEKFLPEGMIFSDEQIETLIPFFQNTGVKSLDETRALENLKKGDLSKFAFEIFDEDVGFTKAGPEGKKKKVTGLVNRRKDELKINPGAFTLSEPKVKKQMGGMVSNDPYKRQPRFI
tara:strand:+ start:39 stop:848 length:810 start_codon:yes stop_codon:yes gene_type:complete